MTVEAAVGRARRGGKERGRKPGDQTERGGGRRKEEGKRGRRGSPALQVPVCRIHQDKTKRLCRRGPKIA